MPKVNVYKSAKGCFMTDGVHPLAFRSTDDSRRSSADQDGVSVPTLLLCNIGHLKCRLLYCPWIFRLTEGVNIVIFPWQWLICWCETISNGGYILELIIYTRSMSRLTILNHQLRRCPFEIWLSRASSVRRQADVMYKKVTFFSFLVP